MAFDAYIAVGADIGHADSININNPPAVRIIGRTIDLSTPGHIRFTLQVIGSDVDNRIATAHAIFRLIRRASSAEFIGSAITFSMRAGGTAYSHYDLIGFVTDPELTIRIDPPGKIAEYDLDLTCYPYPRADAVAVTVSGTLTGSTAAFLVEDIPGHIDALAHLELTDTSSSGVINLIRAAVIRGDFTDETDYTPWLDAVATGGVATDAIVAGALGGEVADITLNSTAFAPIARAVQPAGARAQGPMDGYARVKTSGTAIGATASLSGTVNAPSASTIETAQYGLVSVGATATDRRTSTSNLQATITGVQAGSMIVAVAMVQDSAAPTGTPAITDYALIATENSVLAADGVQLYAFVRRNVAAGDHTVTLTGANTANTTDPNALWLIELRNADAVVGFSTDASQTDTSEPTQTTAMTETTFTNEAILGIVGLSGNGTADLTDFWYAGYEPLTGANQMVAGLRIVDSVGTTPVAPRVRVTASQPGWASVALNIKPKRTSSSTTTYSEPTPGELETGSYPARVQAIDAAGFRGNAVAVGSTPSVSTARSSIDYAWTAVTNATAYALTIQYGSRFYEVITTGTSYELESLAGLKEVAALPATSGAVAPPPRIRATVGTLNDHAMTGLPEVATSGSGEFEIVRLFGNRMLPPLDAPLADTWADYAIEVEGRSGNGEDAPAQVDALWIVPCREPQVEAWIQGMAAGTKRRWLLETHRSGRGSIGWLENTSTGDEAGRLTTAGALLIPPGTSIVLLMFEQAAGVHTFGAQVTATLSVYPRQRWEAE